MTFMHCKKRKLRTGCAPPAGPYNFSKVSGRADLYSALPHGSPVHLKTVMVARNQTKDRNGAQWTGWCHLTKFTKIQFSSTQDHGRKGWQHQNCSGIQAGQLRVWFLVGSRIFFISALQAHRFWVPWNPYPVSTTRAFRGIKASAA
jgi:hypothetical protein